MNKKQLLALVSALGVGFAGGNLTTKQVSSAAARLPRLTYVHALRISAPVLLDGGLGKDTVTAYRTEVTAEADGGATAEDIGPTDCSGDATQVRLWTGAKCKKADGGSVEAVRVVEVRPTGAGPVVVEVYGDVALRCTLAKPSILQDLLDSLVCAEVKRGPPGKPL